MLVISLKRALVIDHLEVKDIQWTLMKELPLALFVINSAWYLLDSTLRSLRSLKSRSIFFCPEGSSMDGPF